MFIVLMEEWHCHVQRWKESGFENSPVGALQYLRDRMYVKLDLKPLKSNGVWIKQKAETLWKYRNKIVELSASELRLLARYIAKRAK